MRSGASRCRPPRLPHDAHYASWVPLASPRPFDKLRVALSEVERRQNASRLNVSLPNAWGPPAPSFPDGRSAFCSDLCEDDAKSAVTRRFLRALSARGVRTRRCLPEQTFERADADLLPTNGAEAGTGPV